MTIPHAQLACVLTQPGGETTQGTDVALCGLLQPSFQRFYLVLAHLRRKFPRQIDHDLKLGMNCGEFGEVFLFRRLQLVGWTDDKIR
jgi:hypothetical protein